MPSPKALPPRGAGPGAGEGEQHGQGPDIGIQSKTSFAGIGANGFIPSDANIAVGKTNSAGAGYIVQVVNTEISVYNKTGTLLTGPVQLDSLWTPLGGVCASSKAGDPIIQYDSVADRWLVAQLGSQSSPYYECIAVSQTGDPRGTYNLYSYPFNNNLNDYPKFGVWPTASNPAYLATYNLFSNGQTFVGSELCAYDRTAMTSGAANPAQLCFTIANDGNFLPSDLDGRSPPADGTPGYFLNFETLSSLRLYELSPDFSATPPSATLTHVTPDMTVASYAEACNGGVCIPQPNSERLDSLGDRLMYRLAYRVFSDHVAMVVNHSVMAGSSVGVGWYELRQSALGSTQCSSLPLACSISASMEPSRPTAPIAGWAARRWTAPATSPSATARRAATSIPRSPLPAARRRWRSASWGRKPFSRPARERRPPIIAGAIILRCGLTRTTTRRSGTPTNTTPATTGSLITCGAR